MFGVSTSKGTDELEQKNIAKSMLWLYRYRKKDFLSITFLLKLHKKMFEDVWKWAGKIRQHELQNPDFFPPHQIWTGLRQLEGDLEAWISMKSFPPREIAARFHERIETVHPFANGNGRFGRLITDQICSYHSFEIPSWGHSLADKPSERRKAYIQATVDARRKYDFGSLMDIMYS